MATDSTLLMMQLGKYTVVEFQTPSLMDPAEIETINRRLQVLVDEEDHRWVLLDMTRVQYISSQFIGTLVSLHKKISALGKGKLILCGVGPRLTELLKITQLDRLLTIKASQSDVLASNR